MKVMKYSGELTRGRRWPRTANTDSHTHQPASNCPQVRAVIAASAMTGATR